MGLFAKTRGVIRYPFRLKRVFACVKCYLTDVKCHFTDAETYVSRVEVYCLGDVFPFLPSRFHLSLFSAEKQVNRVKDEVSRPVHRSFYACRTFHRNAFIARLLW